ncbi:MAG: hypothetical protein H8E41_12940 [Desulfobulbaceae bacterium]|uniref:Conjugal transfer protein TraB n=1 Tax=Candidatus Desulfobia pelagia TaxID=2841692 RepID=A0A8J6TGH9_9BACT|nr:hypothetical protein [Candidatus Desulfobia pelagia]
MTKSKAQAETPSPMLNKPVTDEAILKVTKEIVVKFIEVGHLSPVKFDEIFAQVHGTISRTVRTDDRD